MLQSWFERTERANRLIDNNPWEQTDRWKRIVCYSAPQHTQSRRAAEWKGRGTKHARTQKQINDWGLHHSPHIASFCLKDIRRHNGNAGKRNHKRSRGERKDDNISMLLLPQAHSAHNITWRVCLALTKATADHLSTTTRLPSATTLPRVLLRYFCGLAKGIRVPRRLGEKKKNLPEAEGNGGCNFEAQLISNFFWTAAQKTLRRTTLSPSLTQHAILFSIIGFIVSEDLLGFLVYCLFWFFCYL